MEEVQEMVEKREAVTTTREDILMLTKRADGSWADRMNFVAGIMLQWHSKDSDGRQHYTFLRNAFDTKPHDIVSNGIDDAVLVTVDMFNILLARKVIRPITDEEAAAANGNAVALHETVANAVSLDNQSEEVKKANTEAAKTSLNPSAEAPAVPTQVKIAPSVKVTSEQTALLEALEARDTTVRPATKKGEK